MISWRVLDIVAVDGRIGLVTALGSIVAFENLLDRVEGPLGLGLVLWALLSLFSLLDAALELLPVLPVALDGGDGVAA